MLLTLGPIPLFAIDKLPFLLRLHRVFAALHTDSSFKEALKANFFSPTLFLLQHTTESQDRGRLSRLY